MMAYNIIFYLIFCIAAYVFTEINRRNLGFAVLFTFMVMVIFPFLANTTDWGWFQFIKAYSIIISLFLMSIANFGSKSHHIVLQKVSKSLCFIAPKVLLINLLEAVMFCFQTNYFYNALIGLIVCLTIPKFWEGWSYNKDHILGFDSENWCALYLLWCVNTCLTSVIEVIPILAIPTLLISMSAICYCVFNRDWHNFGFFRVSTLYVMIVLGSFFPNLIPHTTFTPLINVEMIINVLSTFMGSYLIYDYIKHKRSCLVYCPSKI